MHAGGAPAALASSASSGGGAGGGAMSVGTSEEEGGGDLVTEDASSTAYRGRGWDLCGRSSRGGNSRECNEEEDGGCDARGGRGGSCMHDAGGEEAVNGADRSDRDECAICHDSLRQSSSIASLEADGCDHRYHFECILSWSKIESRCPLCKASFTQIIKRDAHDESKIISRLSVREREQVYVPPSMDDDPDFLYAQEVGDNQHTLCMVCDKDDNHAELLLCDGHCGRGCHTYCCEPRLHEVPGPEVDWYCECCMVSDL
jgi:hypothetical protein